MPKPIWGLDKVSAENRDKMMRMLVAVELNISETDSTWKLGQNKPDAVRIAAADKLKTSAIGSGQSELAQMMRDANKGN